MYEYLNTCNLYAQMVASQPKSEIKGVNDDYPFVGPHSDFPYVLSVIDFICVLNVIDLHDRNRKESDTIS